MKHVLVGTSGWGYSHWAGTFYPPGLPRERWAAYYAERFPVAEVKFRHEAWPDPERVATVAERLAEAGIEHAVLKAPHQLTHEAVPEGTREDAERIASAFFDAVGPAQDAGLLEGLLVQFDHRTGPELVAECLDVLDALGPPAPLFVEVRHAHFNEDRHYEDVHLRLLRYGGALIATDSPAATITRPLPGEAAYFRFHGRNRETWFVDHPSDDVAAARYEHTYADHELDELAARVEAAEGDRVLVFFNNHPNGQAPHDAARLMERLGLEAPGKRATLDDFV